MEDILGVVNLAPVISYKPRFLSACLSPLHNYFDDYKRLIEWIELNRILGIEFFSIYCEKVGKNVEKALQHYRWQGIVEVVNWDIPISDIHYHGQLAAINDCLYKNKARTEYLMITDVDEFIIPQHQDYYTLPKMMAAIGEWKSVYMFRHTRLYEVNGTDTKSDMTNRLSSQTALYRSYINRAQIRSKLIVATDETATLGIHEVWALNLRGAQHSYHVVDPTIGLLHHYRSGSYPKIQKHNVTLKYGAQLDSQVSKTLKVLNFS